MTTHFNIILRFISHRQSLRRTQRYDFSSLIGLASAFSLFINLNDADETSGTRKFYWSTIPSFRHCKCEESSHSTPTPATEKTSKPASLTWITRFVYPYSYLPLPRLLTPFDPVFSYPELNRGLARRQKDEEKVRKILSSPQIMEARINKDQKRLQSILEDMNAVIYGKGVTPQMRQDFLIKYGCSAFTEDILKFLVQNYAVRGIIEVGAGNGQWARALDDYHNLMKMNGQHHHELHHRQYRSLHRQFITAYDNMEELPLSPKVYHRNTIPAKKYFFDKVERLSHTDAVRGAYGRVLLLVYPPPGPMALETVLAYLNASPRYSGSCKNDTVVYVGEGRGGANANEAFFDYFLGCNAPSEDTEKHEWVVEKVMSVLPCPGGKGYEKMFVFRRV